MINELIEFRQYTFDLSRYDPADPDAIRLRLSHRNICNHLSGIERAMTIVARYYYYNYDGNTGSKKERIAFVKEVLKAWCGASAQLPEELGHLQGWLAGYILQILLPLKLELLENPDRSLFTDAFQVELELWVQALKKADSAKARLAAAQKLCELTKDFKDYSQAAVSVRRLASALLELADKKKTFAQRMLIPYIVDDEASKWVNDYKKITYDKILADAINDGPLTERLLVCDGDLFAPIRKTRGKLHQADQDRIQKLLAAFLLNRTHAAQKAVVTNKTDIANWCEGCPKMDKGDYEHYLYDAEPLMTIRTVGCNVAKLTVHPEYLAAVRPRLIPRAELSDADLTGCQVFEDLGSGTKMRCITD